MLLFISNNLVIIKISNDIIMQYKNNIFGCG